MDEFRSFIVYILLIRDPGAESTFEELNGNYFEETAEFEGIELGDTSDNASQGGENRNKTARKAAVYALFSFG